MKFDFTKKIDAAETRIKNFPSIEFKREVKVGFQRLYRLKDQFQTEYEASAVRLGWN